MSEFKELSRDFKGIWIPKEIWLNPKLSIQAKSLWAEIDSLFNEEAGGCFASDKYLCAFMGIRASRLQEVLKELRDAGLLVTVSFNGRDRVIKALQPKVTGKQLSTKTGSSYPENRGASTRKTGEPIYVENKEENKDKKYICAVKDDAKKTQVLPAKEEEKKIERSENVFTSDAEHKKLIEKFGQNETLAGYEELAEWKKSAKPAQVKKHSSDYFRLRKWVIPSLSPENKKKSTDRKFAPSSPQKFAESENFKRWNDEAL